MNKSSMWCDVIENPEINLSVSEQMTINWDINHTTLTK